MNTIPQKNCTNCTEPKSIDEFSNNKSTKDGKSCWCKECDNTRGRLYSKSDTGTAIRKLRRRKSNKDKNLKSIEIELCNTIKGSNFTPDEIKIIIETIRQVKLARFV